LAGQHQVKNVSNLIDLRGEILMRNMSFTLTIEQFKSKTKTVTRRLGWRSIKPGDLINGCKKCQGLKKGEKVIKLGVIKIVSSAWQRLDEITWEECDREGFPDMAPAEFVEFFCKANMCFPETNVNRIEFEYKNGGREL